MSYIVIRRCSDGTRDEQASCVFPLLAGHDRAAEAAGGGGRGVMGTHLDVAQVIETLRQNDNSIEETADYLDIPPAQVDVAVRYYTAYRGEVDAWIEQSRALAERERDLWLRREDALAQ